MIVVDEAGRQAAQIVTDWVEAFGAALARGNIAAIGDLFVEDCSWKDVLAFDWTYRTLFGRQNSATALEATLHTRQPTAFRLSETRTPPREAKRLGRPMVEGFFEFDTVFGEAHGFVRLDFQDDQRPRARLLLTTLHNLRGFEEKIGARRPTGVEYSQNFTGNNWLEQRIADQAYADRDPEVLIVGAGHSGLTIAARLKQMGIDALVIDKFDRVGDNWRNRYHSLTLHNEIWSNHLPYIPFPPTWPLFLPKDKLAGWLEAYAEFMELNIWTGTIFLGAEFDAEARAWTASVRKSDGTERTFRIPQLVLAIGSAAGAPYKPTMPGLDQFGGKVLHSSEFTSATDYVGKRVIVVGTGVSGHDVAQELHSNGVAEVSIVQRSSTTVLSLVPSGTMVYSTYKEFPAEDADLVSLGTPLPALIEGLQRLTKHTSELDKDLIAGLEAAGFETDKGDFDAGFYLKYLRRGGGYYINVGCSDLIVERKIGLIQWRNIDRFTTDGVLLKDGTTIGADVVIQATGYENQQRTIGRLLGQDIADKVGEIWGLDDQGFMRNMWKRTGQDRLWIMGGSMIEGRLYSRYLALLIKADLENMIAPGH